MTGANYNLLALLPALGELGTLPQCSVKEFLESVSSNEQVTRLFKVVVLLDDLRRRSEILQGNQDAESELVVLKVGDDFQNKTCLEPFFTGRARKYLSDYQEAEKDYFIELFFRLAKQQAEEDGSDLLSAWVGFEVTLRNLLVDIRARRLCRDASKYLKLLDLADAELDLSMVSVDVIADPLQEDQSVEQLRWNWLLNHDNWFRFDNDEVLAYGVKLLTLHRWYRLRHAKPVPSDIFVTPIGG